MTDKLDPQIQQIVDAAGMFSAADIPSFAEEPYTLVNKLINCDEPHDIINYLDSDSIAKGTTVIHITKYDVYLEYAGSGLVLQSIMGKDAYDNKYPHVEPLDKPMDDFLMDETEVMGIIEDRAHVINNSIDARNTGTNDDD